MAVRDIIVFQSPYGLLGRAVDALVLTSYLRKLIERRNAVIKEAAESGARAKPG
jgi:hypothetical protein